MCASYFCRFLRKSIRKEMSARLLDGLCGGTAPRVRRFFSSSTALSAWPSNTSHAFKNFDMIRANPATGAKLALAKGVACCW